MIIVIYVILRDELDEFSEFQGIIMDNHNKS